MKETPILFTAEMVRAIRDTRKTQTRRVMKPQPIDNVSNGVWYPKPNPDNAKHYAHEEHFKKGVVIDFCPYGNPGDLLWVKETWNAGMIMGYSQGEPEIIPWSHCTKEERKTFPVNQVFYKADDDLSKSGPWVSSLFMPKWASRIKLEITDIGVERLQDMSHNDWLTDFCPDLFQQGRALASFIGTENRIEMAKEFWDSINGAKYPWEANPWCWVVSFKLIK